MWCICHAFNMVIIWSLYLSLFLCSNILLGTVFIAWFSRIGDNKLICLFSVYHQTPSPSQVLCAMYNEIHKFNQEKQKEFLLEKWTHSWTRDTDLFGTPVVKRLHIKLWITPNLEVIRTKFPYEWNMKPLTFSIWS